jgi:hypothetical protein
VFLSKDHKDLVCNLETYNYYFIKKNTKKAWQKPFLML